VPELIGKGGPETVTSLLLRAGMVRAGIFMAVALPLWLAPEAIATVGFGRPDLARYVPFLPLLLALPLCADLLSAGLIALFRQRAVRTAEVVNKLVFALSLLQLPLWQDPLYGIFAAWLAGWAAGIVWLVREAFQQGLLRRVKWSRQGAAARWVRFSGVAYALSLIGFALGRELDILLLALLGIADEAVARYAVCFSFVAMVLALPLVPISGGFDVPLIASLYGQGAWDELRRLFRAFFEYVYLFMLPLVGGGLLLGPSLVGRIYGMIYGQSTEVLFLLFILLGATKLLGITGPFLMAMDREGLQLRLRLIMSVVNIGAALVAIPWLGIAGAALATGASMLGLMVWEGVAVQRFLRPRYPWGFLGRVAIATAVMMATVWGCQRAMTPDSGFPALFGLVVLGGIVYLAMLLWLRPISHEHLDVLVGIRIPGFARLAHRVARPAPAGAVETTVHGRV
jgi:O-antigen/teichoic acid export membrane protein